MTLRSDTPDRPARAAHTLAAVARVAPVYLIPLVEAVERAGFACEALFRGLGLTAADMDVPGFTVSASEAHTVVRRALHQLKAIDLGLVLGMHTRITERGAMALGLMAAATLGDAIALPLQFPGSAGYLMEVHAERDRRLHRVIAEPIHGTDDIAPFLVDIMFAGSVRMRRQVTESNYAPKTVDLMQPRPANAAVYEKFFACPVRFGCDRNVLASDLTWLDFQLPMASPMAYRLSLQLLERELERASIPSTLGLAVERAIRRALPLAVAPAELARSLNMGERSLRRKLALEGLTFRGLLDDARKARALDLLSRAGRSITDVARQTGFSDVRGFSRAFKRWTGNTPSVLSMATHAPEADVGA